MTILLNENQNGSPNMEDYGRYFHARTSDMQGGSVVCAAVADGVSTRSASTCVSRRAVVLLFEALTAFLFEDGLFGLSPEDWQARARAWCGQVIQQRVNPALRAQFEGIPIGTTLTFALIRDNFVVVTSCGDSPAYCVDSENCLHLLLPLDREPGSANVLTQCLGALDSDALHPRVTTFTAQRGERLLLGSDGAFGTLSQERVLELAGLDTDLYDAGRQVTQYAAETTLDNQTLILIEL